MRLQLATQVLGLRARGVALLLDELCSQGDVVSIQLGAIVAPRLGASAIRMMEKPRWRPARAYGEARPALAPFGHSHQATRFVDPRRILGA